ncbi:tail assembly chaperone [Bacillus sp. JJ1127]|uniref:tail assembly chaperone n=1 Tax=Bacillus sp. JJ1127 TaxID=3122952 RepID=UPI002FFE181B
MAEKSYTRFVINGEEHELKFCLQAIKLIDENGGPFQFVSHAMQGGLTNFIDVIYYALIHTGKGFTYDTVQKEVEGLFNEEKLDLDEILKYNKAVVLNSFFFQKTVKKLLATMTAEQQKSFETLYG